MAKQKVLPVGPASERHRMVLQAQEDIILTGGGAGGGKSTICLMKNLGDIDDPYFSAVLCRKTRPELTQPGGLVEESNKMYPQFGAVFNKQNLSHRFPSGAKVTLLGIPDKNALGGRQGLQMGRCLIDEVGDDWDEETVLFLLTRLRKDPRQKAKEQLLMTCNPNPDSFLVKWLSYCLDPDTGVPKPGTENIVRWMAVIDGYVLWADSMEELYEKEAVPRGMINARGMSYEEIAKIPPERLFLPKTFRFIPMTVYDNPYLLPPRNIQYLPNLLSQPKKNQLKFLHGSWKNIDIGQGYFNRSWVSMIEPHQIPSDLTLIRAWDLASSAEPTQGMSGNPDWSVGTLVGRSKQGHYYVLDVERFRKRTHDVIETMIEVGKQDGPETFVGIAKDPGSAGALFHSYLVRQLTEQGFTTRTSNVSGWTTKLKRFLPFCALAESGNVSVLKASWNEAWFQELEAFTGGERNKKDDQVDSLSDAVNQLAKNNTLPSFSFSANDYSKPAMLSDKNS